MLKATTFKFDQQTPIAAVARRLRDRMLEVPPTAEGVLELMDLSDALAIVVEQAEQGSQMHLRHMNHGQGHGTTFRRDIREVVLGMQYELRRLS